MILLPEKVDATSPSSPSQSLASRNPPASPGYYPDTDFAPSSSGGVSPSPNGSLRPPPQWSVANSSETALGLGLIGGVPRPPFKNSHGSGSPAPSQTYLPLKTDSVAPSLTRPPAANLTRTPFQPMFLFAEANSLGRGFPSVLPPTSSQPHPFALHDVYETDWTQFLTEMRVVANLNEKDVNTAYCIPVVSAIPLVNLAVAAAITHHIRRKKPRLVSLLVDKWNHHFFHPRNIEVVLMKGQVKLSGQSDQAVANLYTPRTVNFKAPPVGGDGGGGGGGGAPHGQKSSDKTYRLFVVSMDA